MTTATVRYGSARATTGTPGAVELLPALLDLTLYAGDTLVMEFRFSDSGGTAVDMSGTWSAHVRAEPDDPDPPLAEFTIDATAAATGVITATLAAADTREIPVGPAAHWDLQWVSAGEIRTTHRGTITMNPDVTRP